MFALSLDEQMYCILYTHRPLLSQWIEEFKFLTLVFTRLDPHTKELLDEIKRTGVDNKTNFLCTVGPLNPVGLMDSVFSVHFPGSESSLITK